jgi:hypothetical protein
MAGQQLGSQEKPDGDRVKRQGASRPGRGGMYSLHRYVSFPRSAGIVSAVGTRRERRIGEG